MKKTIHRVDAFADHKYKGNPSGVYFLEKELTNAELQRITFNAGLPITAFVKSLSHDNYNIRWFTPICEVNLCGHGSSALE